MIKPYDHARMIEIEALWWVPVVAVLAMTALGLLAARGTAARCGAPGWVLLSDRRRRRDRVDRVAGDRRAAPRSAAKPRGSPKSARASTSSGNCCRKPQAAKLAETAAATFDTVSDAIRSLNARIEDLQEQIRAARETYRSRRIEPRNRVRSSRRICAGSAPIASSCRAFRAMPRRSPTPISWSTSCARPGGTRSARRRRRFSARLPIPGSRCSRRAAARRKAVNALIEAFTRFNIPYRSGIPPREAIPDPGTVSLFVSGKA